MKTYTIFIHDKRYSVPTLLAENFDHDDHAREYAVARLAASRHYTAIEIWDQDIQLCHLRVQGTG
jgi:hypothetical protein